MSDSWEHPIPRMMLTLSNILGHLEDADANIPPLQEQYDIAAGDLGIIAFGSSQMEADLVIAKVLAPEEHREQFPDWEDRVLKDYILCEWHSAHDRDGDLGWFGRVKFIPLDQEQYDRVFEWFDVKGKKKVPEWLDALYSEYTIKIHKQAPDKVPTVIRCVKCDGINTELHLRELTKHKGRAGALERDGKKQYYIISEPKHANEQTGHIHCTDCDHREHLDPDTLAGF